VDYAVQHFHDEEALQIRYDYPDYRQHKKTHDEFKVTVGDLVQKYLASGSTTELSSDVNKVVVRWLLTHIQGEDKKVGDYIRSVRS